MAAAIKRVSVDLPEVIWERQMVEAAALLKGARVYPVDVDAASEGHLCQAGAAVECAALYRGYSVRDVH